LLFICPGIFLTDTGKAVSRVQKDIFEALKKTVKPKFTKKNGYNLYSITILDALLPVLKSLSVVDKKG
jgi:hypothetical protein